MGKLERGSLSAARSCLPPLRYRITVSFPLTSLTTLSRLAGMSLNASTGCPCPSRASARLLAAPGVTVRGATDVVPLAAGVPHHTAPAALAAAEGHVRGALACSKHHLAHRVA